MLNYQLIKSLHDKRVQQINNFYIEVSLTIRALLVLQQNMINDSSRPQFSVPKIKGGNRVVLRKKADVLNYIDARVSYSEYAQSIVFLIAIAEDYIHDVLFSILMAYPAKILVSAKGKEGEKQISLQSILNKNTLVDVVYEQALSRLHEVMYASPVQYSQYFEKITGFDLGDEFGSFVEIKATRDLLIHNDGLINSIYLEKSGEAARGNDGDRIPIDGRYFEESVRALKKILSTIQRGLKAKYGESAEFAESVNTYIQI